ncbi:unnamed protein product, partial [Ectocarpus sp. 6 AP-2014]
GSAIQFLRSSSRLHSHAHTTTLCLCGRSGSRAGDGIDDKARLFLFHLFLPCRLPAGR